MRPTPRTSGVVEARLEARLEAGERFFAEEADRIARLCHALAERFARGGRLLAFGDSPADWSDVRHVAVEFVHPVIVGKRALPALGIDPAQVGLLAECDDIAIAFGSGPRIANAVCAARRAGCLSIAFGPVGADWEFSPRAEDPLVAQELTETLYHLLWELVHVFFDHRGLLAGRAPRAVHDTGASSFLYPFLAESEHDLDAVLSDVRASVLAKSEEVGALRTQTLAGEEDALSAAARALRACFDAGGRLLALGNGGSATDAMDAVADFTVPPASSGWPARPAIDLSADAPTITAIANDIGTEAIFSRQIIAHARPGDALLAISTSGNSANVIHALGEARNRGVVTIAMVGYDGGRVASEALADHVIVTRSQHIPRIQEAQASASHVLRELVES